MKIRNFLMTAALVMAVGSTFAFKAKKKDFLWFSQKIGSVCNIHSGETDQAACDVSYTGAQCTYGGELIYYYDVTSGLPPTCTIPLRRGF